jgi:hypothetical protein
MTYLEIRENTVEAVTPHLIRLEKNNKGLFPNSAVVYENSLP